MHRLAHFSIVTLALAATPLARAGSAPQAINIDIDRPNIIDDNPPDTYGAAANQPGRWNGVAANISTTINLLGVNGTASGVSMIRTFGGGVSQQECVGGLISINWTKLMCDHAWSDAFFGTPIEYEFSGLNDGLYDVYVYCAEPGEIEEPHAVSIWARVNNGPIRSASCSGAVTTSSFVQGKTHNIVPIAIIAGDTVKIRVSQQQSLVSNVTMNGIQIVPRVPQQCPGDLNGDNVCDLDDLQLLLFYFGTGC